MEGKRETWIKPLGMLTAPFRRMIVHGSTCKREARAGGGTAAGGRILRILRRVRFHKGCNRASKPRLVEKDRERALESDGELWRDGCPGGCPGW